MLGMNISGALREAVRKDGRTLKAMAESSGVDGGQLSRFMRDERSLTLESADKLIEALGLHCEFTKRKGRRSR